MSLAKAYSGMKGMGHSMSMTKCSACDGGECKYASGGEVMGVHKSDMEIDRPKDKMEKKWAGESTAGRTLDQKDIMGDKAVKQSKGQHHRVLGEMKAMPNPKLQGLAEGGEVEDMDSDMSDDDQVMDHCCDELLEAIHSKNKKEILESLKAIIMSVKG